MMLAYLKRIRVLWLSIVCRLESLYLVWSGLHGLSLTFLTTSLIALGHPLVQQKEHLYLKDYIGRLHRRQFQAMQFPVHGLCFALLNFSSSLVPFSQLPLSTLLPGKPIWPLKCDISHILSQTVIFFLFSIFISAPLNPDPQNPTRSTFVPSVKQQLRFLNASAQGRSCLPFLASCPSMSYNVSNRSKLLELHCEIT